MQAGNIMSRQSHASVCDVSLFLSLGVMFMFSMVVAFTIDHAKDALNDGRSTGFVTIWVNEDRL